MNAVVLDGETDRAAFKVHPTRLLDPARQACVLEALERFALDMRVHFKDFVHDGNVTPKVQGYCSIEYVRDMDPDYRRGVNQHYAYRNGRATIESGSRPFIHMFINLSKSDCLRDYDVLRHMTITDMKVDMFGVASTICHEFSHALEQHYCDSGGMPLLNDEIMIETGHSLESFLFGGLYSRHNRKGELEPSLSRWPSPAMYEHYKKYNHPIETRPSMDLGPERCFPIEPRKIAAFLEQSFWDDPEPPVGCWKKMWLRPHCEVALDREDFDYFNSDSLYSLRPHPKKRRRLGNAFIECRELEMVQLNGFWQRCMNGIVPSW